MNRILILAILISMASQARAESEPEAVDALIAKLSDDDFAVREAAQKKLTDLDEGVIPALEKARTSGDAERAARIGSIIAKIRWADWTIFVDRYAVDMLTGNVRWKVDGNEWDVQCVQSGLDVYVNEKGKLSRRSLKDGRVIWERDCEKAQIDVLSKPKLIVFRTQGAVHAWSTEDGKDTWTIQNPADATVIPGENTLLLSDIYCGCFSATTGQRLWKTTETQSSPPAFLPGGDVLFFTKSSIARLASSDGHELWKTPLKERNDSIAVRIAAPFCVVTPRWISDEKWSTVLSLDTGAKLFDTGDACTDATLFENAPIMALGNQLRSFNPDPWKERWSSPLNFNNFDGVTLLRDGDRIFVCEYEVISCATSLRCLNAKSGEQTWKADVTGISVDHSKYHQTARIEQHGKHVFLISQQSGGDFIEAFGAETGASGAKWVSPR